jgi:hypothetical protein
VTTPPLAVCEGEMLPQLPSRLLQLTVQSAPAFELSFKTVAIRLTDSFLPTPTCSLVGETLILVGCGAASMVTVALTDFVESATDVAVTVTVPAPPAPPGGTAVGAVYKVFSALVGLNDPQAPAAVDPHVAVQVTPAPVVSLAIWAIRFPVPVTIIDAGGAPPEANETAIAGASIVTVTLFDADGSPVTFPVIVTVPPMGTFVGAV